MDSEAFAHKCSVKKLLKFPKIHRKTSVSETLLDNVVELQPSREASTQVFYCEIIKFLRRAFS